MKYKKLKAMAIGISLTMFLLSACGKTEEIAEVMTDNVSDIEVEAEIEVPTIEDVGEEEGKEEEIEPEEEIEEKEPLAMLPYSEENKLEFCKDLTIPVEGVRIEVVERSTYENMESMLTITDVSIEELEDDMKSIVVKYEITGDLYDSYGGRFLQPIMPNALFCDLNTGEFQDSSSEILWNNELTTNYTVEWNGNFYDISQETEIEWSSEPDWKYDGKGGYIGPVTMYETNTFIVPRDYDSMGMVVGLFTADEIYSSEFELFKDANPLILEVLEKREGARLYSINELCKLFSEDAVVADDKDNSSTTSSNNGNSTANTNNSSSKDNTTPKQEQPTHTHSYSSSVTKNPSCGENGVMTYTCACGSSYTEAIPASGHQWTTTTETISHPSTGHYETVTKKEIFCGCGASGFQSMDEYKAHVRNNNCGGTCGVTERTENVWVVDSPESQETVTTTKCIVCGAQG